MKNEIEIKKHKLIQQKSVISCVSFIPMVKSNIDLDNEIIIKNILVYPRGVC